MCRDDVPFRTFEIPQTHRSVSCARIETPQWRVNNNERVRSYWRQMYSERERITKEKKLNPIAGRLSMGYTLALSSGGGGRAYTDIHINISETRNKQHINLVATRQVHSTKRIFLSHRSHRSHRSPHSPRIPRATMLFTRLSAVIYDMRLLRADFSFNPFHDGSITSFARIKCKVHS